ncbi:hypothetical protein A3860_09875 [Niastella vici]|uniref:PKD domain-containing protein n=1 Tax=Niastella vici TaxID=1703345 RepID=A0A1V9FEU6_9BACT|nr:PKD domain-containing protein [Niastella vici]OQP56882.1 hypothetical protein A3860_09875 [Niastella vici]
MKNKFPFQKLTFFILFASLAACKKKEIIDLNEPVACFNAQALSAPAALRNQFPGPVVQTDSTITFYNCSDTGNNVTYHWDFGDGTSSDEKNPAHKYARRGSYQVTLGVSVENNRAFDTAQKTVSVVLGEKNISYGSGNDAVPFAIEEMDGNEFVVLSATSKDGRYYLIQLDSLLNQKSMKTLPAGYQLNSMQPTTDGNYIFTGTTQGSGKDNELIKMKADGTLLWTKTIIAGDNYTYAAQTPDGGYAIIGSRLFVVGGPYGVAKYVTVVAKTDNNGNLQWQKAYDQELMLTTRDVVVEQNSLVLAGVTQYNGSCSTCDSLYITKLDYAGNLVWKNTMPWSLLNYGWAGTHISKLTNGNYGVFNDTAKALYYFTPSGNFVDRILIKDNFSGFANAADGNLIVLLTQSSFGIAKYTLDGYQQWLSLADGKTYTRSVVIRRLRNGGYIAIGSRYLYTTSYPYIYRVILLQEMDDTGKTK